MSAVVKAMQRARVSVTLDNWLVFNMCEPSASLDCELLEVVPDYLRSELDERLALQSVYESKSQAAQKSRQ